VETTFDRWIIAEAPLAASHAAPNPLPETDAADKALMQQFQRGNEAAFRQLYDRYRAPLLRFVQRLAPDAAATEEIAQETWMAVIRGRERYLPKARFATYLFSIARRRTMDQWRKRGRYPEPHAQGEDPDATSGPVIHEPEWCSHNEALGVALLAAISALPVLQREAFLLRAEAGLGIEEIAQVTGANLETAKSRLRYALQRLRISLESWQ
jgi:RNA polymerase sigma-70 factor (ECF subfamily)